MDFLGGVEVQPDEEEEVEEEEEKKKMVTKKRAKLESQNEVVKREVNSIHDL